MRYNVFYIMHFSYLSVFFTAILLSSVSIVPVTFAAMTDSVTSVNGIKFPLKINQTIYLESNSIKIKFLNVTADSRCPSGVQCIWQGETKVIVNISKDDQDLGNFNLICRAGEPNLGTQIFGGHLIQVVQVDPYPTSGKKIPLSDYVATFLVGKVGEFSPYKQIKSGVLAKDVQCKEGLYLVIKAKDDSPACVKPSTASTLVLWGWAKSILGNTQISVQNNSTNKIITLEDNGKSISIQKGTSFLLKLGESYNWNIDIDNQTVASRQVNIMVVRGAQGVYNAHNPGQATLTGVGDPPCLTSVPSCKMPSIQFKLDIIVTSSDETRSKSLVVLTGKDQYRTGESINFTITNTGNTQLYPIGWGYSIAGIDGKHYAPNGVLKMMIIALAPGKSISWTWN
jgi:hypothetical protein